MEVRDPRSIGAVTWRVTPRDQIKMRDYVNKAGYPALAGYLTYPESP